MFEKVRSLIDLVSYALSPNHTHADPQYFSTPAEVLCDIPKAFAPLEVPSLIPLETEEMSDAVNLDSMTPADLTKFIADKEAAHKESQKALRALLRAKIALAPKTEAPAVG